MSSTPQPPATMFEGLRFKHWKTTTDSDGVVTLEMDRQDSAVNAISRSMLEELDHIVERLHIERPTGVIIRSAKAGGFAVGADIHEFQHYASEGTVLDNIQYGQQVFQRLAELPSTTVAALHGHCMGGGTELALACRYRVAADTAATRIGLPEVQLGIHPGWGGTARLPRLIGAGPALRAMLTGKPFTAKAARAAGLIDELVPADRLLIVAHHCATHPRQHRLLRRLQVWASNWWPVRQAMAPTIRRRTAAKARSQHYPAPFALIEVWRRGGSGVQQRLRLEAASVNRLAATASARNLIRVFSLREQLRHAGTGIESGIAHVHVVGAGTMGGAIAAWSAWKGFTVTLTDQKPGLVEPALDRARDLYTKVSHGDSERVRAACERLTADLDGEGVASADLAIEAIFEDPEAKHDVYAQLEPKLPASAILASNTSSIPLATLREGLDQPTRFLGLHFFNPVSRMPLIEVVTHDALDADVKHRALAFCVALGKLPVCVRGTPGFLVNRVLMPYLLEAIRLYSEGVPGPVIDRAACRFGMPAGPIELADIVGLDVCQAVGKELAPYLGMTLPDNLEPLLAVGKRGRKDGAGFYSWVDGKAQKPAVAKDYRPPADLQDRLVLALVNEAVACLADGVVDAPDILDAAIIFGTGFAPFRGGPIQYVRDAGADVLLGRLAELAERHGTRFQPRPGWDAPSLRRVERAVATTA